jgi:alkanesulfonate monooxygenase SsuD/methylene tetrahydromethanopterin reductase-like flavin-dependent oxidoreductase (luciferase family)
MFLESISQVLQIWRSEPPYNIEGKYWAVTTARTLMADIGQGILPKPLQRPHPPIITTVVSPHSSSATQAGEHGWDIISANFLLPQWVKTHWPKYQEGCGKRGEPADVSRWRVAKSVFVADDAETARAYATGPDSPYRFYYAQLLAKMRKAGRTVIFKTAADAPDDSVTLDGVCEKLIIHGTPESVAEQIQAFREEVGPFGTMLYAGHDWSDPDLARRSMVLMAEQVRKRLN